MHRIHIIGRKNSGKTTLVCDLIRHYRAQGLKVGSAKHTHHHHELDTPGKDSYRHRVAGAHAVGIVAPAMNAVFWPTAEPDEASETTERQRTYQQFDALLADCDVVLVEGDQHTDATKVEVWREETQQRPLAETMPTIALVVTDDPLPGHETQPRWDLAALADRILALPPGPDPAHAPAPAPEADPEG
jgi:molybdopterin-guanine dinucleotide biosynthesis adapter protein